jgi:hypothetical protein
MLLNMFSGFAPGLLRCCAPANDDYGCHFLLFIWKIFHRSKRLRGSFAVTGKGAGLRCVSPEPWGTDWHNAGNFILLSPHITIQNGKS